MRNRILLCFMTAIMALILCCCGPSDVLPDDDQEDNITTEQQVEDEPELLSEDEVIRIVLDRTEGSSEEDILSFSMDMDDGFWIYEGDVRSGNNIYEFEIDAVNGNILEWEVDD